MNGRKFRDMQDLRETARWWLSNHSDLHKHDTTGRPPLELFMEQEHSALRALPVHPYDTAEVALRVCRVDGFLEHDTNLYSVPFEYVADILTLKVTEREIFVYNPELSLIAHHERKPLGVNVTVEDPGHRKSPKIRYGLEPVREAFLALGGGADEFLKGLKDRHPHHCGFQARYILRLKENYHADDIHAALLHATKYYAFDGKTVERILRARATPRTLPYFRDTSKLFDALPVVRQRPLEDYHDFLKEAPYDE